MNPLLEAILDDDPKTVERLLDADAGRAKMQTEKPQLFRAKIFHWLYTRDTPLHLAAAGYRVEIARLLLAAGADPNAAHNMRRSTPLHYAADGCLICPAWTPQRQVKTLQCLLDNGADIHSQDKNGATALHRAVRTRCAAAVKFLLQAGSDPRLPNKPGSTPFHLAVQNTGRGGSGEPAAVRAQREIIETFLSLDLSPNLKNASGKTVRASAQSAWICELLDGN